MAADLRDDLLLDEITLNINPSKLWKVKQIVVTHRCKILLIGLVLLLSLALIASVCTIIFTQQSVSTNTATCKKNKQPGPGEQKNFIAATREYQVTLSLKDWVNRTEGTIRYLNAMAAVSSLNLDISDITDYIHDEYQVDAKACHNKDLLRIRHYFYPENLDFNTTLGIKNNDDTFAKSYKEPNWPADKVFPGSFQKCEYDVHACFTKYSRESIIKFPQYRLFNTCGDVASMFPWAISVQNVELLLDTPQKLETVYWWLGKNVGYLNENTKYEIEFTLQYKTLEDAIAANKIPEAGEWSIRIFALRDGLDPSHQFDSDGVEQAEAMWNAMLDIFPEPCKNN